MTSGRKKERLSQIAERLKRIYPDAGCALDYCGDPWRLLVMGRLSAQCTDAKVNAICKELFAKYPTAEKMAASDIAEIERIIMPCGLYRMKAANIRDASAMLVEKYGGRLPSEMEELLRFPGVGRKIANLLRGDIFRLPAVVCDTHCIRICGRLGMYPEKLKDAGKIENILQKLIAPEESGDFCHRIVLFGRETCTARNPRCDGCPLADLCARRQKAEKGQGAEADENERSKRSAGGKPK